MTLVFADLVQETTSTTGTGTLTLSGAVSGFQSFAAIGNTNTTYYRIKSGIDSEVGIGTYTVSGTTLSRDTVLYSSAGGTTKITVADGATVSCVYPAERAVYLSETGTLGIGGAAKATAEVAITELGLANSGSLAGSALDLSQTWNTTGNPTAIKLNVTNTASGATSKLMDLQVGGSSKFSVDKSGILTLSSGIVTPTTTINFNQSNVYAGSYLADGATGVQIRGSQSGASLGFGVSGVSDTFVYRDAANTLAQRNGVNSQTSRIYNTYTDASNYERSALSFVTYSGALYTKLAAESAGTGAANIGIALSPKGTGAITAQVPDGTTAGGNARGVNSVDLQTVRPASTSVASGDYSGVLWGSSNSAIGNYSMVGGNQNSATNQNTVAIGSQGNAYLGTQFTFGGGRFLTNGDAQYSTVINKVTTTDAVATAITTRLDIPNSITWAVEVDIVARSTSGADNGYFKRRLVVKKGTTSASVDFVPTGSTTNGQIIGTDIVNTGGITWAANPISFATNTTNGSLAIYVTGVASTTIRWVAKVSLVEVGFA